jgi:hypothetical protein
VIIPYHVIRRALLRTDIHGFRAAGDITAFGALADERALDILQVDAVGPALGRVRGGDRLQELLGVRVSRFVNDLPISPDSTTRPSTGPSSAPT